MIPLLSRGDARARIDALRRRLWQVPREAQASVEAIVAAVRDQGDEALCDCTRRFDGVSIAPGSLRVSPAEIKKAQSRVDLRFLKALDLAIANVERFHQVQAEHSWMHTDHAGNLLGLIVKPIPSVGIYVPGGTRGATPLISTAVMGVVPARIAGVPRIVVTSPPGAEATLDAHLLVALDRLGVQEIYKAGGAQAIAAMAYGTGTIVPVEKIVGPGNLYVALAKRVVSAQVDVDKVAGPSEVLILADATANAAYAAADMLAQAEHDPLALAVLVTTQMRTARRVAGELDRQIKGLPAPRADIARRALMGQGVGLVVEDLDAAVDAVNAIAPEHLEILTADPMSLLGRIDSAGAVFLGPHSPQAVGDYVAGPNHTLPTGGTARRASPLGVWDFVKRTSVVAMSPAGLAQVSDALETLASLEGLEAHARSVAIRRPSR